MSSMASVIVAAVMVQPVMSSPTQADVEPPTWTGTGLLTVGSIGVAAGLATKIVGSVGWADDADVFEDDHPNSGEAPFYDAVGIGVAMSSAALMLGGMHLVGQHHAAEEINADGETSRDARAFVGAGFGLFGAGVGTIALAQIGWRVGNAERGYIGLEVGNWVGLAAGVTGMTLAGYGLGRARTERRAGVAQLSFAPQLGRGHVGFGVAGRF